MAEKRTPIVVKAQLERDRGLLAALNSGTFGKEDLQHSGYGTDAQIVALEQKIAENELILRMYGD